MPRNNKSFRPPQQIFQEDSDSDFPDDFDDVPTVVRHTRKHKDPNAAKGFRLPGYILPGDSDSDFDDEFVAESGGRRNAISSGSGPRLPPIVLDPDLTEDYVEYLDRRLEEEGPRGSASFRLPGHILSEDSDSDFDDDFDDVNEVPTVVRKHKDPNAAKGFRLPGYILNDDTDDFYDDSDDEFLDDDFVAESGGRRNALSSGSGPRLPPIIIDPDLTEDYVEHLDRRLEEMKDESDDDDDDHILDDDFVAESGGRRNAVSRGDLSSGPRRRNAILPPIVPSDDNDDFNGFATGIDGRDPIIPPGFQEDEFQTALDIVVPIVDDEDEFVDSEDDDEFAEALEEEIERVEPPIVEPILDDDDEFVEAILPPIVEPILDDEGDDEFVEALEEEIGRVEPVLIPAEEDEFQVADDVEAEVEEAFATAREEEFETAREEEFETASEVRVINPLTPAELNRVGCMPGRDGTIVVGRKCPLSVSSAKYPFTFKGETFFTVEQFMFAEKAKAFNDTAMHRKIMGLSEFLIVSASNFQNLMGGKIKTSPAGEERWLRMREDKLYHANALKFSAPGNNAAAEFLMKTGDRGLKLSFSTLSDFVGYDEILLRIRTFLRERAGV